MAEPIVEREISKPISTVDDGVIHHESTDNVQDAKILDLSADDGADGILVEPEESTDNQDYPCMFCGKTKKADGELFPDFNSVNAHMSRVHRKGQKDEEDYLVWRNEYLDNEVGLKGVPIQRLSTEDEDEDVGETADLSDDFEGLLVRLRIPPKKRDDIIDYMEDYPLDNYYQLDGCMTRAQLKYQERAKVFAKWWKIVGRKLPRKIAEDYDIDSNLRGPPRRTQSYYGGDEWQTGSYGSRESQNPTTQLLDTARAFKEMKTIFEPEESDYSESEEVKDLRHELEMKDKEIEDMKKEAEMDKKFSGMQKQIDDLQSEKGKGKSSKERKEDLQFEIINKFAGKLDGEKVAAVVESCFDTAERMEESKKPIPQELLNPPGGRTSMNEFYNVYQNMQDNPEMKAQGQRMERGSRQE